MKKKTFKHYQSRCNDVFNAIKNEKLWTLTEIQKELLKQNPPVEMTIQGIKKNIWILERCHRVMYIKFEESMKKISKRAFQRKFKKKLNKYYLSTPKTGKLFEILANNVKKLNNNKKYIIMIEDVIDHYKNLEFGSIFMKKRFADEKLIYSVIKEGKKNKKDKRVFKKEILGVKNIVEPFLKSNWKFKEVKLKVPVKKIDIKGTKYFFVNDELVPVSKLMEFIKLLEFDVFMKWVAYTGRGNRENAVVPAIKAMKDLFVEIVKDSQIKV